MTKNYFRIIKCPNCKKGKLGFVGNKTWECSVCSRGSFMIKRKRKKKEFEK